MEQLRSRGPLTGARNMGETGLLERGLEPAGEHNKRGPVARSRWSSSRAARTVSGMTVWTLSTLYFRIGSYRKDRYAALGARGAHRRRRGGSKASRPAEKGSVTGQATLSLGCHSHTRMRGGTAC